MFWFYYPVITDKAGGVQNLILNIGRGCNSRGIETGVYTYLNGYIQQQVEAEALNCRFIDAANPDTGCIKPGDVIVIFGALEPALNDFRGVNARLFYWSVFPDTMIQTFKIRLPARREIYSNGNLLSKYYTRKLAGTLAKGRAAFFMDESHLRVLENYGIRGYFDHSSLLPIPVVVGEQPAVKSLPADGEPLYLAYIGRAEDWKMFPFVSLIRDLENVKSGYRIIFDIISEDPAQYIAFLEKYFRKPENIQFEFHDNLSGEALTGFLKNRTHLLFAMGTSLLEGCKAGVPAIITDPAYQLSDNNLYRFVSDETGYCLGLPAWIYENKQGKPLRDIFDMYLRDMVNFQRICSESFGYVEQKHNIVTWIDRFIGATGNSKIKLEDLRFAYRFFRVKRILYGFYDKLR